MSSAIFARDGRRGSETLRGPRLALRTGVVGALATVALGASSWALLTALRDTMGTLSSAGQVSLDELVIAVSAAAALVLLLWFSLSVLISAATLLPGWLGTASSRVGRLITPVLMRRWAAALLGVSLVSVGVPVSASASTSSMMIRSTSVTSLDPLTSDRESHPHAPAPAWFFVEPPAPSPLWLPEQSATAPTTAAPTSTAAPTPTATPTATPTPSATSTPTPTPAPTPTSTPTPPSTTPPTSAPPATATPAAPPPAPGWTPAPVRTLPPVSLTTPRTDHLAPTDRERVVRRGDTLWALAAEVLPDDATDAEIATEWQRWYALNRDLIGADPDLILPGQVLQIPAPAAAPAGGRP
ncbi:MAG: LysM peptidoglycan-binding domain-containing protein [Actinomycetia bacterium]|nr:LysM peptidoglycan-binding domain-containing protein [Actinomycetes bacterium]